MSASHPMFLPPVLRPPLPADAVYAAGADGHGSSAGGHSAAQPPAELSAPPLLSRQLHVERALLGPSHLYPAGMAQLAPHAVMLLAASSVVLLAAVLEIHHGVAVKLFGFTLPETCSWRRVWGIDCMGCGLTRSFISLAHLHPFRAWSFNPAGPVLFAGVIYQLPYRLGQLWRLRKGLSAWSAPVWLYLGWIVLSVFTLLTQWIVRTAWPMWIGGG